jgi:hypothetical protein
MFDLSKIKKVRKFVQYGLIYFGTTNKLILNWLNK